MENQNNELEVMRQQMTLLKEKLDSQQIVNDKLLRQSMLKKMSYFNKYRILSIIALAFVWVACYFVCKEYSMSWTFYWATGIFITTLVLFDNYINRYKKKDFLEGDLIETSKKMMRARKLRRWSQRIGITLSIPWFIWFYLEMAHGNKIQGAELNGLMIGMVIGGIIGGAFGLRAYFKMQRINKDIILQIEEQMKGEKTPSENQ